MAGQGWSGLEGHTGLWWRQYAFARGALATTLVFQGQDGLVVVSPGTGMEARDLDALAERGPVRALVANNAFHHMGQRAWRERFPEAVSYAPASAVAVLTKKVPGVPFRPLTELRLPPHIQVEEAPGFKTGETVIRVGTEGGGSTWFVGDLLANMPTLPPPPARWLFSLTDSAPGFRLFRLAVWLMVKDKRSLREWMLKEVDRIPPTQVVPAHGLPFTGADVATRLREQLRRL